MAYFPSFRIRAGRVPSNMLAQALHDACVKEIAAADAALAASAPNPHRRVHQARKALRRARVLLALIARADPAFATVDAKLRRAAHSLSRLRDAAVAVETFNRLMKRKALRGIADAAMPLRDDLVHCRDHLLAEYRRDDPGFANLRRYLQRARDAASALSWARADPRSVARGLARSRRRIAKIEEHARRSNEQHLRHRWRRRLRRSNDQHVLIAEILGPDVGRHDADADELLRRLSRKGFLDAAADKRLAATAHALGLEHDVRLLRQIVRKTHVLDESVRMPLLSALDHRLRKLHKRSAG